MSEESSTIKQIRNVAPVLRIENLKWEQDIGDIIYKKFDGPSIFFIAGFLLLTSAPLTNGDPKYFIGFGVSILIGCKVLNTHGVCKSGVYAWRQVVRSFHTNQVRGAEITIPFSTIDPSSIRIHLPRHRFMRIQYADRTQLSGNPRSLQLLIMSVFARKAVSFTGITHDLATQPKSYDVFHDIGQKYADHPPESMAVKDCPELIDRWYVHTNKPEKFVRVLEDAMVRRNIPGARGTTRRALKNPIVGGPSIRAKENA